MKNIIPYFLLLVIAFTSCKESTSQNNTTNSEEEAKKAKEQRKQFEAKCYTIVKERLLKTTYSDSLNTLDSLAIVAIDTASEKMARANYCNLLLNTKKATDYYVEKQADVVTSAAKVSPILAEPEKKQLEIAKMKQEIANANYEECLKAQETADSLDYKFYQVTVSEIKTFRKGKIERTDTTQSKFYIDKESFELRLF